MTRLAQRRKASALTGSALVVVLTLALSACAGAGTTSGPAAEGDSDLLVWVDATRQPAVEAYAAENPDVNITVATVDGGDLASKLSLLSRDPDSLPDVVFTANGESVAFARDYDYSADLSALVPQDTLDDFGATISACTDGGKVYCLPQDISTQMLWYNQALFDDFGYTVPTTWDEYAELSSRVATEHPGYVTGSCGDGFCPNVYYRGSSCPGISADGDDAVIRIDSAEECTRVTAMLDPLLADKSVATLSPFDPDMTQLGTDKKVLMLPGFVWYGTVLFRDTFHNAPGEIAAAPLPTWGDDVKGAGAAVGGQWIVGAQSSDPAAAAALIESMTTDEDALAAAVTFPAYGPASAAWIEVAADSGFYASDPTETFASARSDVTGDLFTPPGFDILAPFANAVAPKLKQGDTLSSLLGAWQNAISQSVSDAGYTAVIE